jgi:hypothetical protein
MKTALMKRRDMDHFTFDYLQALIWISLDKMDADGIPVTQPELWNVAFIDETIRHDVGAECMEFERDNAQDLAKFLAPYHSRGTGGQDFFLTREFAESDFWDGDWEVAACKRLTANACEYAPSLLLCLGDDERLHYITEDA